MITHYVYFLHISALVAGNRLNIYKAGYTKDITYRINRLKDIRHKESAVKDKTARIFYIKLLKLIPFPNIKLAKNYESYILNKYKEYRYYGSPVLANGNSELFVIDIAELEFK